MATAQSTKPLTDTAVRNLKPGSTVIEKADSSSPGLRLRVTPAGKKVWFYRFRDPASNKLQKVTLGYYPDLKLAEARTIWSELAGVRRKRQNPKPHWQHRPKRVTPRKPNSWLISKAIALP